jgi:hypothetical protein
MEINDKLHTIGTLIIYETVFHNDILNVRPLLGLLLLCYKYIKLQNRNANVEKVRLFIFALIWCFPRKCDSLIYGYLFTDNAHEAAFLGLLTPHLTYIGNILYALILHEKPQSSVVSELNTFVEKGFIDLLGFEDVTNDN